MANFSKEQLDKFRALLEKVGVKPECPACKKGTGDRPGTVWTPGSGAIARRPHWSGRWHGGIDGEDRHVCAPACNTCGFVRMHALTALGLDNMM